MGFASLKKMFHNSNTTKICSWSAIKFSNKTILAVTNTWFSYTIPSISFSDTLGEPNISDCWNLHVIAVESSTNLYEGVGSNTHLLHVFKAHFYTPRGFIPYLGSFESLKAWKVHLTVNFIGMRWRLIRVDWSLVQMVVWGFSVWLVNKFNGRSLLTEKK